MIRKNKDPHHEMSISPFLNKKIMSAIRGGDYQHLGEEEAIELLLSKIDTKLEDLMILDVGSGLGGTVNKLFSVKVKYSKSYNKEILKIVYQRYLHILESLKLGLMGGILIKAIPRS
jgi:hypothetical protein